jgi:hypothetical protein
MTLWENPLEVENNRRTELKRRRLTEGYPVVGIS